MLSQQDRDIIMQYAKHFEVQEVYLFGSALDETRDARDIDLAVRGIAPQVFFAFYGKLLRYLSKPVDVVNLSRPSRFTEFIKAHAVKIYG